MSVVAASTRPVALAWEASGFYSWFQVSVRFERFIRRGGIDVLRETLVSGRTDQLLFRAVGRLQLPGHHDPRRQGR